MSSFANSGIVDSERSGQPSRAAGSVVAINSLLVFFLPWLYAKPAFSALHQFSILLLLLAAAARPSCHATLILPHKPSFPRHTTRTYIALKVVSPCRTCYLPAACLIPKTAYSPHTSHLTTHLTYLPYHLTACIHPASVPIPNPSPPIPVHPLSSLLSIRDSDTHRS